MQRNVILPLRAPALAGFCVQETHHGQEEGQGEEVLSEDWERLKYGLRAFWDEMPPEPMVIPAGNEFVALARDEIARSKARGPENKPEPDDISTRTKR